MADPSVSGHIAHLELKEGCEERTIEEMAADAQRVFKSAPQASVLGGTLRTVILPPSVMNARLNRADVTKVVEKQAGVKLLDLYADVARLQMTLSCLNNPQDTDLISSTAKKLGFKKDAAGPAGFKFAGYLHELSVYDRTHPKDTTKERLMRTAHKLHNVEKLIESYLQAVGSADAAPFDAVKTNAETLKQQALANASAEAYRKLDGIRAEAHKEKNMAVVKAAKALQVQHPELSFADAQMYAEQAARIHAMSNQADTSVDTDELIAQAATATSSSAQLKRKKKKKAQYKAKRAAAADAVDEMAEEFARYKLEAAAAAKQ
jgi:hypothetical protein